MPVNSKLRIVAAQTQPPNQGLFPYPQAAAYLTIGTRSLKGLVAAGKIPVVQVSARRIAFRITDLDAYIASKVR